MEAGAVAVDISPPLPVDVLGYVRRAIAPRALAEPLMLGVCAFREGGRVVFVAAADLVGMTPTYAAVVRGAMADATGCDPSDILVNMSHTHASLWPGAQWKMGGEFDDWTAAERAYFDWLPHAFASAAVGALARLAPARASGGVGHAPGVAVNRRERTDDGRTILGWNRDGFVEDEVPVIRVDSVDGAPIATLVGFGCHPVVVGPEVPLAGPDFVGRLRRRVEESRGGVCLFLQGAAGNVLPLEAFHDAQGPEIAMGERLALEAVHAMADADPRAMLVEREEYGSVTPIALYRRVPAAVQPTQTLRAVARVVRWPLLPAPPLEDLERELAERRTELRERKAQGEGRALTNPVTYHVRWLEHILSRAKVGPLATFLEAEMWAARIGSCAIVGAPGEIFSEIGHAVRAASPATVTIFAGYSQGVLGYVATPDEYPHGGYEPSVSHRGYGAPAPFSPSVAAIIRDSALDLLGELFSGGGPED